METTVAYIRKSTNEQANSFEAQLVTISNYCNFAKLDIQKVYQEECSGGVPLEKRKVGKQLIADVKAGLIQNIVATRIDRLFRNTLDALQMIELFDKYDVALHLVDLHSSSVNTKSPMGRFMLQVMAAVAELERGLITQRVNESLAVVKSKGVKLGAAPYGFMFSDDRTELIPNPDETTTYHLIQTLYHDFPNYLGVARILNEQGLITRTGKPWNAQQVKRCVEPELITP